MSPARRLQHSLRASRQALLGALLLACTPAEPLPSTQPPPPPPPAPLECFVQQARVQKGDTAGLVMTQLGVSLTQQGLLLSAAEDKWDLAGDTRVGDLFQVERDQEGALQRVLLQRKPDHRLLLSPAPDGEGWQAAWEEAQWDLHTVVLEGTIESSLWEAAQRAGLSSGSVAELIAIFDWQVDFFRLQKGDRFRVAVEEKSLDGIPRGYGTILAGRFQRGTRDAFAIRFTPPEAHAGYYDREGGSNRRLFLASPVDFARVSSHYSRSRYHPVLKVRRAHKGTDYAAGPGTPIRSIGDGVVIYAGRKGGYGKHVRIRHKKPYNSSYSHMSKISVRVGQEVEQGQILGKVGSTGLATGPHLHFEFYKGGTQVNWERQDFPAAEPLEAESLPLYEPVRDAMVELLVDESFPLAKGAESRP